MKLCGLKEQGNDPKRRAAGCHANVITGWRCVKKSGLLAGSKSAA